MTADEELLARMQECRDAIQEAKTRLGECLATQKRVAEVVDLLATAYERINERLNAIEQRLDFEDEYRQEGNHLE